MRSQRAKWIGDAYVWPHVLYFKSAAVMWAANAFQYRHRPGLFCDSGCDLRAFEQLAIFSLQSWPQPVGTPGQKLRYPFVSAQT